MCGGDAALCQITLTTCVLDETHIPKLFNINLIIVVIVLYKKAVEKHDVLSNVEICCSCGTCRHLVNSDEAVRSTTATLSLHVITAGYSKKNLRQG